MDKKILRKANTVNEDLNRVYLFKEKVGLVDKIVDNSTNTGICNRTDILDLTCEFLLRNCETQL
jgi:hypothetical protein